MLVKGYTPNVIIYTSLVNGLSKEGKLDKAKKLFYEFPNKNICPSISHTMHLLMVYVSEGNDTRPPIFFMRCLIKGTFQMLSPYNILIDGISKEGKLKQAL